MLPFPLPMTPSKEKLPVSASGEFEILTRIFGSQVRGLIRVALVVNTSSLKSSPSFRRRRWISISSWRQVFCRTWWALAAGRKFAGQDLRRWTPRSMGRWQRVWKARSEITTLPTEIKKCWTFSFNDVFHDDGEEEEVDDVALMWWSVLTWLVTKCDDVTLCLPHHHLTDVVWRQILKWNTNLFQVSRRKKNVR